MQVPVVVGLRVDHSHKLEGLIKFLKVDEPQGIEVRLYHISEFPRESCNL